MDNYLVDPDLLLHRQAVADMQGRCAGSDTWVCTEALLFVVHKNMIQERLAVWTFPSDGNRVIQSLTSGGVDEYCIFARFYETDRFERLSLGVCRTNAGIYERPSSTHGDHLDKEPMMGEVVRIYFY